jgi:hypothetical protein
VTRYCFHLVAVAKIENWHKQKNKRNATALLVSNNKLQQNCAACAVALSVPASPESILATKDPSRPWQRFEYAQLDGETVHTMRLLLGALHSTLR